MLKNILFVKASSLGDIIHALPAVSDMRAVHPSVAVDWVVEETFASIPSLHPAVDNVLVVATRRWRRALWRASTRAEIALARHQIREQHYDAVIDAQGLLKSALITTCARGLRYGLDWRSAREPLGIFYDRTFDVPWSLHAVERNRILCARALGYPVPRSCDYGIRAIARAFEWIPTGRYAVLLHATSGDYKLWPEANWIALAQALNGAGSTCILPWGNAAERERAARIAVDASYAIVAPPLTLAEFPALFAGAAAVIGVDTGLTHLAGALGIPTVGIYCGTDPHATGLYECERATNLGGIGAMPDVKRILAATLRYLS